MSYWGSYFKYRKSCMCSFSSLGAGVAAACAWELSWCCCVHLGAWVLALQGAGVPPPLLRLGAWVVVPLHGRCCVRLGDWGYLGSMLVYFVHAPTCSFAQFHTSKQEHSHIQRVIKRRLDQKVSSCLTLLTPCCRAHPDSMFWQVYF